MNPTVHRSLELFTLVGLFVGSVMWIEASRSDPPAPRTVVITDLRATISENDHAPAAVEELPLPPVAAVPGSRDPEPPAVQTVIADATLAEPAKPAEQQPAPAPQRIPQPPRPVWQPVYQPEQPCRRRGIGGLFQWLDPFSN